MIMMEVEEVVVRGREGVVVGVGVGGVGGEDEEEETKG